MTSAVQYLIQCTCSFMVAAPQVGNGAWEMSKFFMDKFSYLLNKVNRKRQQLSAKITCQLDITEYGGNKYDVEACQNETSENKVNLNFTLNLDDSDLPLSQSPARKFKTKEILQRKPSLTINRSDTMDDDTFEHILQVTSQHETIMAYYYLDENNKVKVTEIFDVTDSDSPIVQTSHERDINRNLEFDDDWDESTWTVQETMSDHMSEYILDGDNCNIFSGPESDWMGTCKIEEPEDELYSTDCSDHRPESDQPNQYSTEYLKNYKTAPLTYEEIDT